MSLPVVENDKLVGYGEVLTGNQKDDKDRQIRIEELLIKLTNETDVMKNDIEQIKKHLQLVTNEESP